MAFHFSLESVLKYRKSVEQAEEAVLQQIAGRISAVQFEMRQVGERQTALREQRDRDLGTGLPAVHLQGWAEQEADLRNIASRLQELHRRLEIERQKQLEIFQKARRDRELLSRIREQRHQTYRREEARKEQKSIDDLYLIQLFRK